MIGGAGGARSKNEVKVLPHDRGRQRKPGGAVALGRHGALGRPWSKRRSYTTVYVCKMSLNFVLAFRSCANPMGVRVSLGCSVSIFR